MTKLIINLTILFFFLAIDFAKANDLNTGGVAMKISSPDFENNGVLPSRFTCDGDDINPTLLIEGLPNGTKSLAIIVEDPDAPMGTWIHWVLYDIPVTSKILENSVPGTEGFNDFRRNSYGGPCPPSGTHRYFFKVYAVDRMLNMRPGMKKSELLKAMGGHILGEAELVGLYKRK